MHLIQKLAVLSALLLASAGEAGAISGGARVAAEDIPGKAAVMVVANGRYCSGLVYADSFVITNAHCLLSEDFKSAAQPSDVSVVYGLSLKAPNSQTRRAAAIVIHEHFLEQFAAQTGDKQDLSLQNSPSNTEDIGLIRVEGIHPAGALSARLPKIANEYSICCISRPRSWPLIWLDVYGFGAAPKGDVLSKLRVSAVAPDTVRPGKELNWDQPYIPRQLLVEPREAEGQETKASVSGICHGDSGGPAFYVTSSRSKKTPTRPARLTNGEPFAVGLVTRSLIADRCSDTFILMRLDYYRGWILSHIAEMRKVSPGPIRIEMPLAPE